MLKLPRFIKHNLALKITSLNSVVVALRLVISVGVQNLLAQLVGEIGIAKIGQLRNVVNMAMSFSTLGIFNGIVKYVAEHKSDQKTLLKLFSTTYVFFLVGAAISFATLFFTAEYLSELIYSNSDFAFVFKILACSIPLLAMYRIFHGVISGLSAYKSYAKVELVAFVISTIILLLSLFFFNIKGVLFAIAFTPFVQFFVLIMVFGRTLKSYIAFKALRFQIPFAKQLLAFSLMSFVSTVLINYIEIDLRNVITTQINESEAGYWTAMTFISKNYMVFITGLFTLYVIPKFSLIKTANDFKNEVFHIYKTILPLFFVGMLLIYFFRDFVIWIVYPNFKGMEPLFLWQLLGDFVRLMALVLAHQFLAKKLVRSFVFTELFSLMLFYVLANILVAEYQTVGVVMAHFFRYILYFFLVLFLVVRYFKSQSSD